MTEDPADSPIVRQVLFTNDLVRLVASFVQSLFTVAEPERVKAALETILGQWDIRVETHEKLVRAVRDTLAPPPPKEPLS